MATGELAVPVLPKKKKNRRTDHPHSDRNRATSLEEKNKASALTDKIVGDKNQSRRNGKGRRGSKDVEGKTEVAIKTPTDVEYRPPRRGEGADRSMTAKSRRKEQTDSALGK